ncbi:galactose-proton symport [Pyrenophora seminiperda CCB06]|uniref:Galactose-proton symport n=1 Tax=Pyrenophora seminiperda CCB06 TaxID=1302712 RepID=A0A3M7M319_9PLEO|nr:galactose-proton symport [Pyrenophora seminiperda CCB06]
MSPSAVPSPAVPPAAHTNGKSTASSKPNDTTSSPSNEAPSPIPAWVKPDLSRLLRVEHNPGSFTSRSVSLVTLPSGAVFARITNPTPAIVAYSSVQASRNLHIELNSDLVYINHSCAPSLVFDMARWEIRVSEQGKGLKEGDELTFFYPSTEWVMAQPFDCLCKTERCVGRVSGARDMDAGVLGRYWLNRHVEELLEEEKHAKA